MTREDLCAYLQSQPLAVVASINKAGAPQSAVVGIAVSGELEIIFDTVDSSRKYANLMADPRVALVIGWDNEVSVQLEGTARLLPPGEPDPLKEVYYGAFPEGRERAATWKGLVHFVVTPHWARYSDFKDQQDPVHEWDWR